MHEKKEKKKESKTKNDSFFSINYNATNTTTTIIH